MKQLVISVILAVCLVGCGEKSRFLLNKDYSQEFYANNPDFIKVDPDALVNKTIYKFTRIPESVDSIKTSDLDALGGYVELSPTGNSFILIIKGKASFDKLIDRLNQIDYAKDNGMDCRKIGTEKGNLLWCLNAETTKSLLISYNPFTDSAVLTVEFK